MATNSKALAAKSNSLFYRFFRPALPMQEAIAVVEIEEVAPPPVPVPQPVQDNVLEITPQPRIPRYVQLARSIHARFTAKEEQESALIRAAEVMASNKNGLILRPVREIQEFMDVLSRAPEIVSVLNHHAHDITTRIFDAKRSSFTVEQCPIALHFQVPLYQVNMNAPEHIMLTGEDTAYLQIGISPVNFITAHPSSSDGLTTTLHLLCRKYKIEVDGTFTAISGDSPKNADPIADILSDLRGKLGHDFFNEKLLPWLERNTA
jgi:hypothetical protein